MYSMSKIIKNETFELFSGQLYILPIHIIFSVICKDFWSNILSKHSGSKCFMPIQGHQQIQDTSSFEMT